MAFSGTSNYIASKDLQLAVNAAITLERPLLIKGEPGTGKTMLAEELAESLGTELIQWHIKSTTKAQQGLYEYDAVSRLRDSQLGDDRVHDISNYIVKGKLWEAFSAEKRPVLLIDEIDKADIEFPNDLLLELDKMEFFVYETQERVVAKQRPIVIITSNNEKELPDAFLRRCFFHYIQFPNPEEMQEIVNVHFPDLKKKLLDEALKASLKFEMYQGLRKSLLPLNLSTGLSSWLPKIFHQKRFTQKTEKLLFHHFTGHCLKTNKTYICLKNWSLWRVANAYSVFLYTAKISG